MYNVDVVEIFAATRSQNCGCGRAPLKQRPHGSWHKDGSREIILKADAVKVYPHSTPTYSFLSCADIVGSCTIYEDGIIQSYADFRGRDDGGEGRECTIVSLRWSHSCWRSG